MAEGIVDHLDVFVTLRSFTVELQTCIEKGTATELHTVTVRNVVELAFRCDICQETAKTFDSLKRHWQSSGCGSVNIRDQTIVSLKSPVKNALADADAPEALDINDIEIDGDLELTEKDNDDIENGINRQTETNDIEEDGIAQDNSIPVQNLLLDEGNLSAQTDISQSFDQNVPNVDTPSKDVKNADDRSSPVGQAVSNRPTEERIENLYFVTEERSEQSVSQDGSEIENNREGPPSVILICSVCKENVPRNELDDHFERHFLLKCKKCHEAFNSEELLKEHSKIHVHKVEQSYPCIDCDKTYVHKSSLKQHILKHAGVKPHQCAVCGKSFGSKSDLSRHETRHGDVKPYQCPDCGKSFADKSYLTLHLKRHKAEILYSCEICEVNFTTKSQLTMHYRKHTGEKPYACKHCNQTFANQTSLKYHEARHTGHRPFECEVCQATFIHKNALSVHSRAHSGEKPYKCKICGRSFARNSLKLHMRYHTGEKPFKCDICGNQFVTKTHLATHMRCHSGEKPFSCDKCDKSFGHKSSLIYHSRSHTGEKPFSCPLCGKGFMNTGTMKRHAITCAIKRLGNKNCVKTDRLETSKPSDDNR